MAGMRKDPNDSTAPGGTSLWTTPVSPTAAPLQEASVDASVSAETVRAAVDAAKDRVARFSGRVTEELLRKSF
jgi:hypothetical protein